MVGLPRRPRNISPIIQALLAQSQQQLPNRSGPANVAGKIALALSATLGQRRERKREDEEAQAEEASARRDVSKLTEALLPIQKPGVPSPLDPGGEVQEFDRDAIRQRGAIAGVSSPQTAIAGLEAAVNQRQQAAEVKRKAAEAQSVPGKLFADVERGLLTRKQAQQLIEPDRQIKEDANGRLRFVDDGSFVFDIEVLPDEEEERKKLEAAAKTEKGLRTEFFKLSGDFFKQREAHGRVEAAAKDPSPAGDLALIFNYMKVLDPNSVVRESEFATAENTGNVAQRVWVVFNKVLSGERLSPGQREDFLGRSRRLFVEMQRIHGGRAQAFAELTVRTDPAADPANVVPNVTGTQIVEQGGSTYLILGDQVIDITDDIRTGGKGSIQR